MTCELTCEKIVFGGQTLGHALGKAIFVWGALPGEQVQVRLTRKKKDFAEGVVETVVQPSALRQLPLEEHYLSCSPWQIMSPADEQHWKQELAQPAYWPLREQYPLDQIAIEFDAAALTGYRNKMEYSFWQDEAGLQLAFFERGSHWRRPITPCVLAQPCINTQAQRIVDWLHSEGITAFALKSLILIANERNQVVAALFCKIKITWQHDLPLDHQLVGFHIYFSNPKTPAAVPTELLFTTGEESLTARVLTTSLQHHVLGFFQVNIPMFERALTAIQPWLESDSTVLDYYAGVGSISLPLAQYYRQAILVEQNAAAAETAAKNISALRLAHCRAVNCSTEEMLEVIERDYIVIVDPPRVGLSMPVIDRFLATRPKRLLYLSCNIATQARDLELLLPHYTIRHLQLFNFFPRTPHIEGLAVLDAS